MPLHQHNARLVADLRKRWYFSELENAFSKRTTQFGLPDALDYLTETMRAAQEPIEALLDERVRAGAIRDKRQSRVSIAGNGFQGLIGFALAECQRQGLLDSRLIFALKTKSHALIKSYATIAIANEAQRPDFDLLIYCEGNETGPIGIFSIKTSLRERAGQTYRWKLLLDIAIAANSISLKERYGLRYEQRRPIWVSLITADFYNEMKNPQQRGAFAFFHSVYVTKPVTDAGLVKPLSSVLTTLNQDFCEGTQTI